MKIPFYQIISFFISTFKVDLDTKLIEKVSQQDITKALVVKRSWIFAVIHSWVLILTTLLTFYNAFNISKSIWINNIYGIAIVLFLFISLSMLLYSSIIFIIKYKRTYWKNWIEDIEIVLKELKEWDELFKNFYNQIITNILMFVLIIFWYIFFIIYNTFFINNSSFSSVLTPIFDIGLLWIQIYLMLFYMKKMIDLEMDFNVIVPWLIYFYNQTWIYSQSQNLQWAKIKTINDNSKWLLNAIFNMGSLSILTEWDQWWEWMTVMYYVENPKETRDNIYSIVNYKSPVIKNRYLIWILSYLWLNSETYLKEINKEKINNFLKRNDTAIRQDYERWDLITKNEIKEIYEIINSKT